MVKYRFMVTIQSLSTLLRTNCGRHSPLEAESLYSTLRAESHTILECSILPADGLVADYVYNADLTREGFNRYAAERHIDYFITPYLQPGQKYDRLYMRGERTPAGQIMDIETPLTRVSCGSVTLSDTDLLFRFREVNPDIETTMPEVGVWRIPHENIAGATER